MKTKTTIRGLLSGATMMLGVATAQAAFILVPGGIQEHFDGTTVDYTTWNTNTFQADADYTISQNNELIMNLVPPDYGSFAFETREKLVQPGELVRVEVTPNGASLFGSRGNLLMLGAEALNFDYDTGNYMYISWYEGDDAFKAYARGQPPLTQTNAVMVASDHPIETTYVFEIARAFDGKSATFSLFLSDGVTPVPGSTPAVFDLSAAGFDDLWGDLRVVLISNNGQTTFDNVFISEAPEPTTAVLLALGGGLIAWRRRKS